MDAGIFGEIDGKYHLQYEGGQRQHVIVYLYALYHTHFGPATCPLE